VQREARLHGGQRGGDAQAGVGAKRDRWALAAFGPAGARPEADAAASADGARSRTPPPTSMSAGSAEVSITPRRSSKASQRMTMVSRAQRTDRR
jgi:hypothetical protein